MKKLLSVFLTLALTLMLIPVAVCADSDDPTPCASITSPGNGHTYVLYDESLAWTDAEEFCESIGGYLATITSAEEQECVESLINEGGKRTYWIGLKGDAEDSWLWVSGEEFDYENWGEGEPNNDGGNEAYVEIVKVPFDALEFGTWNDMENEGDSSGTTSLAYKGFICEYDKDFTETTSDWSTSEIEEAYESGLIPEFLVDEDLTERISRAEFASVSLKLYEALTGETVTTSASLPFTDVAGLSNYSDIQKVYALDIAVGTSATTFDPNAEINREQLATMLCRTIKKYSFADWTLATDGDYYLDTSGVKLFEDDDQISDYARQSVYYMAKMGIINGVDDTHFAPQNTTDEQEATGYATATREQAIALSLRIYKLADLWK
ncbi:MAG: S-layer homology domain-containing protein [Oscillospiraceae bacterium]|nr:S-layer homology domain-containing protein [Oscillospiraceae bacterium]